MTKFKIEPWAIQIRLQKIKNSFKMSFIEELAKLIA